MHPAARRFAAVLLFLGSCCLVFLVDTRAPHAQNAGRSAAAGAQDPPRFVYDGTWPKLPLPNKWTFGGVTGLTVDNTDVIWVLHRPNDLDDGENFATLSPPTAECCVKAPAVLAFDVQGNLVHSWDTREGHMILVDKKGQVWVGSNTFRIFTKDGKAIAEFPRAPEAPGTARGGGGGGRGRGAGVARGGADGNAPIAGPPPYPPDIDVLAGGVEGAEFDEQAREVFLVDNYMSGRVMVFDMDPPFKFKRGWGAYGKSLKDITPGPRPAYDPAAPPSSYKDFLGHVTLAIAGNEIYVADRSGDRVQVFTKDGKFVREFLVAPETRGRGSAGGLAPSKDPQQRYLYVSDIMNNVVWIVNRQEGKTIGRIGFQGHSGGGFRWLHMVATDSKGNVYTGEVDSGKRIQKFVPRR